MSLLAVVAAAAASLALGAEPYVRTRAQAVNGAHCLVWESPQIEFRQNSRGNADTTGTTELGAFAAALATWNAASGACASIVLTDGPRTDDHRIGWNENADDNMNLVVYRAVDCHDDVSSGDECWASGSCQNKHNCWDQMDRTIAVTTTTYHPEIGRIYDTDIEGNEARFVFTTVDAQECPATGPFHQGCVATDVQNTMTHELGHALGLDHAPQTWSTMYANADVGEISKRELDSGTREFLCETYPRGGIPLDCVVVRARNRLGEGSSCAAAAGAPVVAAVLAVALALRRRRRAP